MSLTYPEIELRTSPHIKRQVTTDVIMLNVVYALVPVAAFGVWLFGLSALLLVGVCTASTVLTEHLICRLRGKESTITDYSAVITGILLALTLPPGFPLWMAAVGGVVAVGLGKAAFGGLGFNPFNPALVGRAFLQAAFPVAITTWTPAGVSGRFLAAIPSTLALPFMKPPSVAEYGAAAVDGFSGATPLAQMKFEGTVPALPDLVLGTSPGTVGETSAILILLCGAYLVARRMMDWRIPVSILVTVFIVSGAFALSRPEAYPNPFYMLFSGGLMLGAVFMATDMVGSPSTPRGVWIYGILIGILTVVIRLKGGLPEGVMYAILLGNAATPHIDALTQPRIYGARKEEKL